MSTNYVQIYQSLNLDFSDMVLQKLIYFDESFSNWLLMDEQMMKIPSNLFYFYEI